jgi:hypothetical protein
VAVAQFDAPASPDDEIARAAQVQFELDDEGFARMTTSFAVATDGRTKLVRANGAEQIIDLAVDPLELSPKPVRGGEPELAPLRAALDSATASERKPAATTSVSDSPAPDDDEMTALEDQMRLLGYLD